METANATAVDMRRTLEGGVTNPQFGKEVTVEYSYDYTELKTFEEVVEKFSKEQLVNLANQRIKSSANSTARQKAIAQYAASGEDAAREDLIKNLIKMAELKKKTLTREQAETLADAQLAAFA